MSQEKIDIIYDIICSNKEITKKELLNRTITEDEIAYLIENEYLEEIEEGKYDIIYTGDLLDYAKTLLYDKKYNKASIAVDRCFVYNPDDFEVNCFRFLNDFMEERHFGNYDKTINSLYELRYLSNEYEERDVNLYLFLMSNITMLPDDLRLIAKYMRQDEIMLKKTDERYEDIYNRNNVKKLAFYQKFSSSLKATKLIKDKKLSNMIYDRTIAKLLEEASIKRKDFNKKVNKYIKNKDLERTIDLFAKEEIQRSLTRHESNIYSLTKKYLNIIKTRSIPQIRKIEDGSVYDLIENNDFKTALERITEVQNNNNSAPENSILYVLLKEINDEIDSMKNAKRLILKDKQSK